MICQLEEAVEVVKVFPQEIGESLSLRMLSYPSLLFLVLLNLHRHLSNVCGYYQPLHTLQCQVYPREVACQDLVVVANQVPIHKRSGSAIHGKGIQ